MWPSKRIIQNFETDNLVFENFLEYVFLWLAEISKK